MPAGIDPDTGRVKAAVGGNLLTALRTAAASAVSIRYLAPQGAGGLIRAVADRVKRLRQ